MEKARKFQKNLYFCSIDYTKTFDYVDHNKLWKILKKKGVPDHLTCLLRNLYVSQEATVRTLYGTMDWVPNRERSMSGLYILTVYLTYMQSTSGKMPGWMNHKLESRLPGEISPTSNMQMITLMAERKEELKGLLMKVKEESEKVGLKLST